LRLDLQYGWVDTVRGGLPIKEIAVHAVEDGVTLIPLMPPHGQTAATAHEVTRLVETLKSHFDLLIMDGPSAASPDALKIATAFDSAVLVRDVTRTGDSAINEIAAQMQGAGVQGVGVVDNFV
jgi:MinD-like ATPase involved in chromosome partitioning or flagellar assembly